MRALFFKLTDNIFKFLIGNIFTFSAARNFAVLAINAAETAAAEKNRAGAVFPAYTRLLPFVEHNLRNFKFFARFAKPKAFFGQSFRSAITRTFSANHSSPFISFSVLSL